MRSVFNFFGLVFIVASFPLLNACDDNEYDVDDNQPKQGVANVADPNDTKKLAIYEANIRNEIDFDRSSITTSIDKKHIVNRANIAISKQTVDNIGRHLNIKKARFFINEKGYLSSDFGDYRARIDPRTSRLLFYDNFRFVPDIEDEVADDTILERAKALLKDMDIDQNELEKFSVNTLMARDRVEKDSDHSEKEEGIATLSPPRRLAKKVFFWRTIGDVEVLGDDIVITYNLDGRLRRIRATWHSVDYNNIQYNSEETEERIIDLTVNKLISERFYNTARKPIVLKSFFIPETQDDGTTGLNLVVGARVQKVNGRHENSMGETYLIDI